MTDWVYPDSFKTLELAADWVAVISTICCVALLLSWGILPVEKTHRHYLSICLTIGVLLMGVRVLWWIEKGREMLTVGSSGSSSL